MKKFTWNAIGIIMVAWAFLSTVYLATMGLDFATAFSIIAVNSFILIFGIEWIYK